MDTKNEFSAHSDKVLKKLEFLNSRKTELKDIIKDMVRADNGKLYEPDILAFGAAKRTFNTISGFKLLVENHNMICARSLLRTQIDTAIRFYALFIVPDPRDFVRQILAGKKINDLFDIKGHKMSDSYLISLLKPKYPWLEIVYKNLSGYVHLSSSHLFDSIASIDDFSNRITWEIDDTDDKYKEDLWIELIDCFNESINIFFYYLKGWVFTKNNPELVSKMKSNFRNRQ